MSEEKYRLYSREEELRERAFGDLEIDPLKSYSSIGEVKKQNIMVAPLKDVTFIDHTTLQKGVFNTVHTQGDRKEVTPKYDKQRHSTRAYSYIASMSPLDNVVLSVYDRRVLAGISNIFETLTEEELKRPVTVPLSRIANEADFKDSKSTTKTKKHTETKEALKRLAAVWLYIEDAKDPSRSIEKPLIMVEFDTYSNFETATIHNPPVLYWYAKMKRHATNIPKRFLQVGERSTRLTNDFSFLVNSVVFSYINNQGKKRNMNNKISYDKLFSSFSDKKPTKDQRKEWRVKIEEIFKHLVSEGLLESYREYPNPKGRGYAGIEYVLSEDHLPQSQ